MENDEENKVEEETTEKKERLTEKMRENPWILSTLVLGILTLIFLVGNFSGNMTGNVISEKDAGEILLSFASSQLTDMEILGVEKENGLYKIIFTSSETGESKVYTTFDGKYLINGLTPLLVSTSSEKNNDVPKSDKPEVELFVMTHCPYGTQAEKGIISTIKALGDSADVKIRFVHYFMHEPEETETPIQVCIREEQPERFLDYLECFLEDGDSDRCLTKANIDKTKMNACISNGKAEEYYNKDSQLSQNYGVEGSPTLVINGVIVSSGRDSASYLDVICSAFNGIPGECSIELSSASPSPGFGWEGTGSATSAQC